MINPPPTSGPPVAIIVIVVLVIIGIVIAIVIGTSSKSPSTDVPQPASAPGPKAPAPAPAPVGFQFDESCVKPALQSAFQGDAPFIPDYINFLKSNKVQTAPLGAPCPSGTTSDRAPPGMNCQPCVPNELINNTPPMPDSLQKQIDAWYKMKNTAVSSPAPSIQSPPPVPAPPAPAPAARPASAPGPKAPVGSSPMSSMGREVAVSAVAKTPDQLMAAKQAEAQQRASVYAGMTQYQINEQLAQAQRDAGKRVEITRVR